MPHDARERERTCLALAVRFPGMRFRVWAAGTQSGSEITWELLRPAT